MPIRLPPSQGWAGSHVGFEPFPALYQEDRFFTVVAALIAVCRAWTLDCIIACIVGDAENSKLRHYRLTQHRYFPILTPRRRGALSIIVSDGTI
jgi:hypothetical protein